MLGNSVEVDGEEDVQYFCLPAQRTPLAVSVMENPRGHTRATSWQPPWLQARSQPYSPQAPGGSVERQGAS